ncbi:hypothetical protein GQ54DRAFT_300669 [Martensiomyces pterosporus]|nr:hypothetical protein GQ54DRAFT_300669 [Martensiomyces pterosporus]
MPLRYIAGYLLFAVASASSALVIDKHVNGDEGLAGVLLLVAGLYLTFLAHRYARATPWVSVLLMWFSLVYFLCVKIYPPLPQSSKRHVLYVVLSVLLSCALTLCVWCAGGFIKAVRFGGEEIGGFGFLCLGGLAGVSLSFYLLAMYDMGLVPSSGGRAAFTVFWVVLLGGLTVFRPRRLIAVCSPIVGAYMFVLGVDCFAHTGYSFHLSFFTGTLYSQFYHTTRSAMALQATALVMAVLGSSFQHWRIQLYLRHTVLPTAD